MQYSSSIYTWMAKRARNSRYTCVFWIRITWWLGGVSATATSIWTHAVPKSHKNSNSTHGQQLQVRYHSSTIFHFPLESKYFYFVCKNANSQGRELSLGRILRIVVVKYYARVNFQSNIRFCYSCSFLLFSIQSMFMNRILDIRKHWKSRSMNFSNHVYRIRQCIL